MPESGLTIPECGFWLLWFMRTTNTCVVSFSIFVSIFASLPLCGSRGAYCIQYTAPSATLLLLHNDTCAHRCRTAHGPVPVPPLPCALALSYMMAKPHFGIVRSDSPLTASQPHTTHSLCSWGEW